MIQLHIPVTVIKANSARYCKRGIPAHRPELLNDDDHTIVGVYGTEYRGIVNYYLRAHNIRRLNRLHWVMETSMLKTLAGKHKSTVAKMACRYKQTIDTRKDHVPAFKQPPPPLEAANHWLHDSVESRSSGSAMRSFMTAMPSRSPPANS